MSEKSPYASKFWIKSYDDFVPHEVEIDKDLDLAQMLRQSVKEYPDSLVYEFYIEINDILELINNYP
ncbi:MAG: hypothetical protein ACTSR8_22645 [Promethearchaeota archaeon]